MSLPQKLEILVGTYNINQQLINQPLKDWLFSLNNDSSSTIIDKPDILAIGFQEFSPYPYAFLNRNTTRLQDYAELIEQAIIECTHESYTQIVEECMVGLSLFVYVRDSTVVKHVKQVKTEKAGVGPFWMGNKGAVAAFLELGSPREDSDDKRGVSLCFVCAHLAAHNHNVHLRNTHFRRVCERLLFPKGNEDQELSSTTSTKETDSEINRKNHYNIYDSDYLFFFGDLNYRISLEHPTHPPITLVSLVNTLRERQHHRLSHYDQLSIARTTGSTLHGFEEGQLSFAPTYKFHTGSNEYNTELRIPGWCDRILYFWHRENNEVKATRSNAVVEDYITPAEGSTSTGLKGSTALKENRSLIKLENYISHPQYTLSDHKPVSALFTVTTLNPDQQKRIFESPFKIDPWYKVKRQIGEVFEKIAGALWWICGTPTGLGVLVTGVTTFGFIITSPSWDPLGHYVLRVFQILDHSVPVAPDLIPSQTRFFRCPECHKEASNLY
ncbi:751_t:CDS:2 [Ambispora gerdemannii]|uniref:751_t:CDS:1 n=1 Tax=Ambispora gerdemannii TaxID=144530 RepID=A0A9N8YNR5_9GLOM|nr:751_t:CDS:2 [Ambispora gerdemannii]